MIVCDSHAVENLSMNPHFYFRVFAVCFLMAQACAEPVVISGIETWDGISNPHVSEGVQLSGSGAPLDPFVYTLPDDLHIGPEGVLKLDAVASFEFRFTNGNLEIESGGRIDLNKGGDRNNARTAAFRMNGHGIHGSGLFVSTGRGAHGVEIHDASEVFLNSIALARDDATATPILIIATGIINIPGGIDVRDLSEGGGSGGNVTLKAERIRIGDIRTGSGRTSSGSLNGNVEITALGAPFFDSDNKSANDIENTLTLTGVVDTVGALMVHEGGHVSFESVMTRLGPEFELLLAERGLLSVRVGEDNSLFGQDALFIDEVAGGAGITPIHNVQWTPPPFRVVSTEPADGASLSTPPTSLLIQFSEEVDSSSLAPGDLTVAGVGAVGHTVIGEDTVRFDLAGGYSPGVYETTIAQGAISSVSGAPILPYMGTFRVLGEPTLCCETVLLVQPGSVSIHGEATENPNVEVYYGSVDGGTTPMSWEFVQDLGAVADGPFTATVSGLLPETEYFFRFRASNGVDHAWSDSAIPFTTPAVPPPSITEFLASNSESLFDEDGDSSDWLEVHNPDVVERNFEGWFLTDDLDNLRKWQFPFTTIPAGGYLVIFASGKDRRVPGEPLHTSFRLAAGGEPLALVEPDGVTIAWAYSPLYPEQQTDVSYGRAPTSDDLLYFLNPTPGAPNGEGFLGLVADTKFNRNRGFYDFPIQVSILTQTPGAVIRYTTNGSAPTENFGFIYEGPINVDETTTLRAAAFLEGYLPTNVDTQTYLFLDDVVTQQDMDVSVVNNPLYSDEIKPALESIPSLSIVMNPDELFGSDGLAGDNAREGEEVEYACSFELIDSNPSKNLQIDCGIEGHSSPRPKRSFRLNFRRRYGNASLEYPLFESAPVNGDSAVEVFDQLVLRGGGTRTWAGGDSTVAPLAAVTYLRDQWVRDTQIAMSGHGSHGTFVHLYLNGRYWGLYNLVERPNADFTSSYFGGEPEDWFAVNHKIIPFRGGRTLSGDPTRFNEMNGRANSRNLENSASFAAVEQLLDLENHMDFCMLHMFSGFADGLDNNWYGGNRNNPPGLFRFFMWDGELTFHPSFVSPAGNTVAWVPPYFLNDSLVNLPVVKYWRALWENIDYRIRFADRAYAQCFHEGAFTDPKALGRWDALVAFVEDAMIGESARWSAGRGLGRDDPWRSAVATVRDRIEGNANRYIQALKEAGLYPSIDPPVWNQRGGIISPGFELEMNNPNGEGTIYVTEDGSDPRGAGGAIAPTAIEFVEPILLESDVSIRSRVFSGGNWSAQEAGEFDVKTEPRSMWLLK